MSRAIPPKASVTIDVGEAKERNSEQGKLLFTTYRGQECALLIQKDRLRAASFYLSEKSKIGAIYIGRIKKVAKNLNACFVEIKDKIDALHHIEAEVCFLPMKNAVSPYLTNRPYDGRLIEGDEILVQIERDAQKTKQATVTAHISLTNGYFVISAGNTKVGYSSKLKKETKDRIKYLFTETAILRDDELTQDVNGLLSVAEYERMKAAGMLPDNVRLPATGCIVRTKAGELIEASLHTDARLLFQHFYDITAQYIRLLQTALHRSCFTCLKEPASGAAAALEQLADDSEYDEIVTDSEKIYEDLQKYKPSKKLRLYKDDLLSLPKLYSVDSRMDEALGKRVWLKSGGYLIIEPTEALTVIDVNSGKYEAGKGHSHAETCRKINWEAAAEIAIQLRLRNLSGIILVDFINMEREEEKRELLSYLRDILVKTTVVDITPLGLVELTRKKTNKPLAEQWAAVKNLSRNE